MTRTDKFFSAYLLAIVGLFASAGYELAAAPQEIVTLERVVVVGKRAETQAVVQLPRVVVTAKRDVHADDLKVAAL